MLKTDKRKISELSSVTNIKNNLNCNFMKDIKVEQRDLDESISTDNSNSNEKSKGMNLR